MGKSSCTFEPLCSERATYLDQVEFFCHGNLFQMDSEDRSGCVFWQDCSVAGRRGALYTTSISWESYGKLKCARLNL